VFSAIKVLLVDSPQKLRDSVRNLIQSQDDLEIVEGILDPVEILLKVKAVNADVVIVTLPDKKEEPGVVSHLLSEYPKLLIIAISRTSDIAYVYRQRTAKEAIFNISSDEILRIIRTAREEEKDAY
jgi:DNA-binding NarL/FixJ family response regulator